MLRPVSRGHGVAEAQLQVDGQLDEAMVAGAVAAVRAGEQVAAADAQRLVKFVEGPRPGGPPGDVPQHVSGRVHVTRGAAGRVRHASVVVVRTVASRGGHRRGRVRPVHKRHDVGQRFAALPSGHVPRAEHSAADDFRFGRRRRRRCRVVFGTRRGGGGGAPVCRKCAPVTGFKAVHD